MEGLLGVISTSDKMRTLLSKPLVCQGEAGQDGERFQEVRLFQGESFELGSILSEDHDFCDVTFVIGDEEIKCRKVVIGSRNKYFKTLMRWSETDRIVLEDEEMDVFTVVKEFLYLNSSNKLKLIPDPKVLFDILVYSKKICVD